VKKLIAVCGLTCTDCDAYKATQKNDDNKRQEVAKKWTSAYNHEFKAADINCDGCLAGGRIVGYCQVCPIRKCGQEKEVKNCGYCDDYPCSGLDELFKARPDAKVTLDKVQQKLRS
jgi:hypothetical protein